MKLTCHWLKDIVLAQWKPANGRRVVHPGISIEPADTNESPAFTRVALSVT
ncbi:MAG: hypothetical protein H7X97_05675 [Opitutaceae bacterium]|nr:hypothetical protein [Verrucomicrobiales bacterium]